MGYFILTFSGQGSPWFWFAKDEDSQKVQLKGLNESIQVESHIR